jgi:hypothetical protein
MGAVHELSTADESTWYFRVQLWLHYFDQFLSGSALEYAFGQPFGTVVFTVLRVGVNLVSTTAFPHNFYLYSGFYLGAVGLAALLAFYALSFHSLWSSRLVPRPNCVSGREISVFLVSQLVFSTSYGLTIDQAVFAGAAVAVASTKQFAMARLVIAARWRADRIGPAAPARCRSRKGWFASTRLPGTRLRWCGPL